MTHVRQQIRSRVATVLTGLATTGNNVFQSHVYPIGEDQLPGLCIYTISQESQLSSLTSSGTVMDHQLDLAVAAYVKETSTYDQTIDAIMVEVEEALQADATLKGLVKHIYPRSLDINLTGEGDKPVVVATQVFQVWYRARLNEPEVAL